MRLLDFLKKPDSAEPPIPANEKKYYQPDSYYASKAHQGTQFECDVITFENRKKISAASVRGLYVAEILLLEYCSYGKYPNPQTGYPGFWWFEYGIRNVGAVLKSLEQRGFISLQKATGKYELTQAGKIELKENEYVPYMHKHKLKTTEDGRYGPVFNVWSINLLLGKTDMKNWKTIVNQKEAELLQYLERKNDESRISMRKTSPKLSQELDSQDKQLELIQEAEKKYDADKDINSLILFWEKIWANGGLLFNSSKWTFRLPDLYIKQKRYDDALKILQKIKNPQYTDKKKSYIEKIKVAKSKTNRK